MVSTLPLASQGARKKHQVDNYPSVDTNSSNIGEKKALVNCFLLFFVPEGELRCENLNKKNNDIHR